MAPYLKPLQGSDIIMSTPTETDEARRKRKFLQETEWQRKGYMRDGYASLIGATCLLVFAPLTYSFFSNAEQNHTMVTMQIWLLYLYNVLGKTGTAIVLLLVA